MIGADHSAVRGVDTSESINYRTRMSDPSTRFEKSWSHRGLECGLAPTPELAIACGPFNGYVRVPAEHPAAGKDYDDLDVDVHGGLTFDHQCDDGSTWFGWDNAHSWPCGRSADDETEALADQLADMTASA